MNQDAAVKLLYLIGQPGAGKSTLFAALTEPWRAEGILAAPSYIRYYSHQPGEWETSLCVIQLGLVREKFSGTDALPMNIQPKAVEWLNPKNYPYKDVTVIAEGDRLANSKFFSEITRNGANLSVVLLDCPDALAEKRRAARGSEQDPVWLKGRATKVRGLAQSWVLDQWILSASLPLATLVSRLREHPFLK